MVTMGVVMCKHGETFRQLVMSMVGSNQHRGFATLP
jgi:hypothetical protein